MKLTKDTLATLELPPGKNDMIFFDEDVHGWGLRLRRRGDRVKKCWVVQYRSGGRQRRMTLKGFLEPREAREQARQLLARVVGGADPQGEKKQAAAADRHTLAHLAAQYIDAKQGTIRPRSMAETVRYLQGPYFKSLHNQPADSLQRKDVAAALLTISQKHGQVAAARARSAISSLFMWAMQNGVSEANPVIGTAKPKPPPPRSRVLSDQELASVWRNCRDDDFGKILKLLVLTGQRRNEVGGMRWSEISDDKCKWTIPSERSKNHREHELPLGEMARSIIASVPQIVDRGSLFGARGVGFTSWAGAKRELDARCGDMRPWTLHDIRRTVATKLCDIGIEPFHVEALLNHRGHRSGVAAVYNHSRYTSGIQKSVAAWDRHLRDLIEGVERRVVIDFPQATA
jgi:integrase